MAGTHKFLRLRGSARLPVPLRGAVIAIGNFDGVHQGHKAVLQTALAEARKTGRPALVFTFEPHPKAFFKPEEPLYRLTTAAQKAAYFKAMGFDAVIEQPFTAAFAALSAGDFIQSVLQDRLAASAIIAGANFHFGYKRQGTPAFLQQAGRDSGFITVLVAGKKDKTGKFISSSRIRALLESGEIQEAEALLGHPYTVQGEIIRGRALGQQLGFPTANMALPAATKLRYGIYAVCFRTCGKSYQAVASFGRRPTIEAAGKPLLESFIFDFDRDIYGKQAEVLFVGFLRKEEKFAGIKELMAQMRKDVIAARAVLALKALP
ncbi:bifunctional riboflavin kinase/FAD synthetase [Candidatus Tokpelaia sp.]|uniref:bifunctional riboflavin kinase/FAD synthetase n=1 Tax=Candidatus Tokpelaia sp. TaxID=2233777 RepID=UPI0012389CB5|nr:bifunctional riboflavin kinase/FAD synthetase [Candidatus Tokpelaia sp.]KAA6405707.1 bifunctional riboflavin kinase/FAD synthetase [Candidatus Tokpelaia sp.]